MNENQIIFQDTVKKIETNQKLCKLTDELVRKTKVYPEGFFSERKPEKRETHVFFEEDLTLLAAKELAAHGGRTAVLNFANPIEPGGGVKRGANAQEEYLCRESNLYYSLTSPGAEEFYRLHQSLLGENQFNSMFLATDAVIYSPNVTVFKTDTGMVRDNYTVWQTKVVDLDHWFQVDVVTCAAPFFSGSGYVVPNGDLRHLLERRIANILETAIENGADRLVLGAFGCGAFHNPPQVVAKAFSNVLLQERYAHAFAEVKFAVKRTGSFCENIEAFELELVIYKRGFSGPSLFFMMKGIG